MCRHKILAGVFSLSIMAYSATYQEVFQRARQLEQRNDFWAAAPVYAEAKVLATNDADRAMASLLEGRNLVRGGENEHGRVVLEQALASNALKPDDCAQAWEWVAQAYQNAGQLGDALQAYKKMTEISGVSPACKARGFSKIGEIEYIRGNYAAARTAWEEAVSLPKVAGIHLQKAWPGIGRTYMAEGKFMEAQTAFQRALAAENADESIKLQAEIGLGDACYEAGDYPAACKTYLALAAKNRAPLRAIERLDTIFRMQLIKADDLLAAGKPGEARAEYEKVFNMEQVEEHHKSAAQLGIGCAFEREKKYPEARAAYEKVLAMAGARFPDKGRAQLGIARCYEAEGDQNSAKEAYANLLKMSNVSRFDIAVAKEKLGGS